MKNNNKAITRSYQFEIRSEENEKGELVIEGRPIVYESTTDIGLFDEEIARGALNDTDLRDVLFLINHNMDMIPLARSRNNNANSTLQLIPDNDGMLMRARVDRENNEKARALCSAIERGDIDGMSFRFTIDEYTWENLESEHPKRIINKIDKVFEISAVNFPAYRETSIQMMRDDANALENAREALENAKSESKRVEDINNLESMLNDLESEIENNDI